MNNSSDSLAQMQLSIDEGRETIIRVETALAERKLNCHSSSALGSLFAMVHRLVRDSKPLNNKEWRKTFLRAMEAIRIAQAVEAALDDPGAKEAIHRVTRSDMSLATRQESRGKDALWELDLYRRFKLGGSPVHFEEPDLLVSLGDDLGDYAIACKKIYSTNNIPNSFNSGCEQIIRHGNPGVVALNLDDLIPENHVYKATTSHELQQKLNEVNIAFIKDNEEYFQLMLEQGGCEGVLVSLSVISDVPSMRPNINTSRASAVWSNLTGPEARARFNAFHNCHDRICATTQ